MSMRGIEGDTGHLLELLPFAWPSGRPKKSREQRQRHIDGPPLPGTINSTPTGIRNTPFDGAVPLPVLVEERATRINSRAYWRDTFFLLENPSRLLWKDPVRASSTLGQRNAEYP